MKAFFLLFCLSTFLHAQSFLVGYVTDELTGDPIAWVNLTTESGKKLGQANSDGEFAVEINSSKLLVRFSKAGYEKFTLDLKDLDEFVDVEISLTSKVKQLSNINIFETGDQNRKGLGTQSIEELEKYQGLRIDLNDHLSQLPGVSGIGEFSSNLSINGGRNQDVVSYLGGTRIPNLRHLDFGLPGNQSVLNPRVLQSISVEDNLSKGPVDQGNSSALAYRLKQASTNKFSGDVVFGTFNREINATWFLGKRTFITSFRLIQPTFLSSLANRFFAIPKETRLDQNCNPNVPDVDCTNDNPLDVTAFDALLSTSYLNPETGKFSRWTFLAVSDDFSVGEDISGNFSEVSFQTIERGTQFKGFASYESSTPLETGELFYSVGGLLGNDLSEKRDTSMSNENQFYLISAEGTTNQNLIGDNRIEQSYALGTFSWTPDAEVFRGNASYHLNLEYRRNNRSLRENLPNIQQNIVGDFFKWDAAFRWNRLLGVAHQFAFSVGLNQSDFSEGPSVFGNAHYEYIFTPFLKMMTDFALRQNHELQNYTYRTDSFEGVNNNQVQATNLEAINSRVTTSTEAKVGLQGGFKGFNFSLNSFYRYYFNPLVPEPDVYWNFQELSIANFAQVFGGGFNVSWNLSPYVGLGSNVSVVHGNYDLTDGTNLAWEANRSLDWVLNFRLNPRGDSLFSVIVTYVVNNDVPLYQYELNRDQIVQSENNNQFRPIDVGTRRALDFTRVSRRRVDLRTHLDLGSKFKPLERVRFYLQATNIFSNFSGGVFRFLGSDNQKQRGWTRLAPDQIGNLTPVLIQGLGFFILFGFEMNFSI